MFKLIEVNFVLIGGASFSQSDDNSRPLSPETDAEDEFNYPLPEENQPIMVRCVLFASLITAHGKMSSITIFQP